MFFWNNASLTACIMKRQMGRVADSVWDPDEILSANVEVRDKVHMLWKDTGNVRGT